VAHAVRNSPINADKFDLIENSSLMEKNDKVFNLLITIGYIFKCYLKRHSSKKNFQYNLDNLLRIKARY
jgi:hypothetical protein